MTVPSDPGTGLQDNVDTIYLSGTTGLHNRFLPLYTVLSGGLQADNMDLTANFTWTGTHTFTSDVNLNEDVKLYFDADDTANSYIVYGSAGSELQFFLGASEKLALQSTVASFQNCNLAVASTQKIFLDGGGDTYFASNTANQINMFAGGTEYLTVNHASTLVSVVAGNFAIPSTSTLYLDGGGDTGLSHPTANTIDINTGGTTRMSLTNTYVFVEGGINFAVAATGKILLDGASGDTYITEAATGQIDIVASNTAMMYINQGTSIVGLEAGIDLQLSSTSQINFAGGTTYYIDQNGDFTLRSGLISFATSVGIDTSTLYLDGGNAGAGAHSLLRLDDSGADFAFKFSSNDTTALGSYVGRITIQTAGGTRYIPYYS